MPRPYHCNNSFARRSSDLIGKVLVPFVDQNAFYFRKRLPHFEQEHLEDIRFFHLLDIFFFDCIQLAGRGQELGQQFYLCP